MSTVGESGESAACAPHGSSATIDSNHKMGLHMAIIQGIESTGWADGSMPVLQE
jgi:hypothetical protein